MTGRNDAAVKELQQALKIDPQDASARTHLARVYQAMGRNDEAKAELSTAGNLNEQTDESLTDIINRPPTLAP
jgi:Flp pilus assembly protein TadD